MFKILKLTFQCLISAKEATSATPKKRKTTEEKKKELSLLSKKLSDLQESILDPTPLNSTDNQNETPSQLVESSESKWSDSDSADERSTLQPVQAQQKLQHPHFSGKRPKAHHAPPKCINVSCKEEKQTKDATILQLQEEMRVLKEELCK